MGAHAKFLEKLARFTPSFPGFIRDVRDKIHQAVEGGASPVHISVFCRAGEIRSVGFATLLSHCLKQNGFHMVSDINFMTKATWRHRSCKGSSCKWCWIGGPSRLCPEAIRIRQSALYEAETHFES